MLAKVLSCATIGLEGVLVEVEVATGSPHGNPGIVVVGLPDAAVQESRERVRAAIRSSGGRVPSGRIVVNLAPADIRKEGPAYDLPIAIGLLMAGGGLIADLDDAIVVGELSLDGAVRHTTGILPMVALAAREGVRRAFVPADDADEAALVEGIDVYPIDSLAGLVKHLTGQAPIPPYRGVPIEPDDAPSMATDFAVVRGQEHVKRGLEVAAAGAHNVLLSGPPGTGKTLLARALPSILPPLEREDAIEVTKIFSVAGMLPSGKPLVRERPFRSPHHTVSYAGLVGGGRFPRPGEISLAHNGVLFLDELPEFKRTVLEVMRQPLEDRVVTISRAKFTVEYPASFMLVAAMNPCPCGYHNHPERECVCAPGVVQKYLNKISGPLLDRIDIHVEVTPVNFSELASERETEKSGSVRERVMRARSVQEARYKGTRMYCNAQISTRQLRKYCRVDAAGTALLQKAMERLGLSARAYDRILKVARTIADLAASADIRTEHLAEAIQYRSLDREAWAG